MSLDYPFYEELCRRRHRAAKWWRIGDWLYYLGLLPAMFAIPYAGIGLVTGLFGAGWHRLGSAAVIFPTSVFVFLLGVTLKGYSYKLAARDGINASDY